MISRREGDKYVCKKTKVPFRVRDMDLDGSFVWKVSTSENDFGTDLTWKTSYRIGRVVGSQEEWPGPSKPIFIRECKEEKTSIGKKVHLTLLDNSKWVVRLPEVKVKARIDCDKKYEELVRKSKAKEANNSDLSNIKIRAKSKKKEQKCYSRWQTSYRVSYLMSGEGFTPGAGIPTKSGECRYAYSGYLDDPLSASLECLSVHKYNWVYLPLTCLKDN
jgi:hypothetical protein